MSEDACMWPLWLANSVASICLGFVLGFAVTWRVWSQRYDKLIKRLATGEDDRG